MTVAKLLVGSSYHFADIRYASGFHAPDAVVFLQHRGRRILVVPPMEYGRARREAAGVDVRTSESLGIPHGRRRRLSEWVLGLLRQEKVRTVEVAPTFPVGVADRLRRAGVQVNVARGPLFPERAVKTAVEIARMREVQQAAVIALRAAVRKISQAAVDGGGYLRERAQRMTSESVRVRIEEVLLERNCVGRDTIVACGEEAADPHARGSGPLRAGEPIVIDIFPQHREHGYWGDLTRTVVRGRASREVLRMYRAVRAAQQAALKAIKPGIQGKTVHRKVQEVFDARGYRTVVNGGVPQGFTHGTGHGVGLEVHEAPTLGVAPGRLRAGHVVTVEPGLYYPGIGGVRIEDTVVVTPHGWRYLVPCEKNLEVGRA
ncbi:MAG: aminopeptidase P family protein [Kiritimatiellae bacterium]|nr:aminopeptidase P family protein [Kiritimatiellia bacterium]